MLLASNSACDIAWGAHIVSERRLDELAPALREALTRVAGNSQVEWRLSRLHIADALWAIRADLPSEAIGALFAGRWTRVTALLIAMRNTSANAPLLASVAVDSPGFADLVALSAGEVILRERETACALAEALAKDCRGVVQVTIKSEDDGPNPTGFDALTKLVEVPRLKQAVVPPAVPPMVDHRLEWGIPGPNATCIVVFAESRGVRAAGLSEFVGGDAIVVVRKLCTRLEDGASEERIPLFLRAAVPVPPLNLVWLTCLARQKRRTWQPITTYAKAIAELRADVGRSTKEVQSDARELQKTIVDRGLIAGGGKSADPVVVQRILDDRLQKGCDIPKDVVQEAK